MPTDLEYIEAYFNQTLTTEEVKQFESRIIGDKDFAGDVAFYLSAKQALKEQGILEKKEWFRQLLNADVADNNLHSQNTKRIWLYRISAAAAILILIIAGYLIISKPTSPERLADRYLNENLTKLPVTMSTKTDSVQNGLRAYNEAHYDSAIKKFETILQTDTANYLVKKYLGIVYLRTGNYDKALLYFHQLENYSLFSNPAIFYQALTLMKRNQPGDKQKAKQLLQQVIDRDLEEKEIAQQWLKHW